MKKIGIIGLGLIGGSLAKAFKRNPEAPYIVAMDASEGFLSAALQEGIIDRYTTVVNESFLDCEILFICTPVHQIFGYLEQLIPYVSTDCIITDVGSTKNHLIQQIEKLSSHPFTFIGGHPMTGSEKTGYHASKAHLFENAYYVLSPLSSVSAEQVEILKQAVASIGAIPVVLASDVHDFVVASISHVPHVLASALVNMVKTLDSEEQYMYRLAAGGFKDITRIASASPEMWHNICVDNKREILHVLETFKRLIDGFETALNQKNDQEIWRFFEDAKEYRNTFSTRSPGPFIKSYEIFVDVVDEPGIIAKVATLLSNHGVNIKNIGIIHNREFENGVLQIIFDREENQKKSIALLKNMNYSVYNQSDR